MVKIALRHVIPKLLPSSSIEKTTKKKTLNGQYIVLFPVKNDNNETQIEIHFGKHISMITNPDMLMESNYVVHKIDSLILPNMSEFVKPDGIARSGRPSGSGGASGSSTGTKPKKPKKPETRNPPKPAEPIAKKPGIIKRVVDKIKKPKQKKDDKQSLLGSGSSSKSGSSLSLNGKVL